ncbi:MAG: ureD [Herminiimonas sp.]|nr:ureD [Herminiimonas sp.]MDB5855627.1 ureD [Herminiimonas sp.]
MQKSLYPEDSAICHAIVVHPPGGVAGGDALHLDIGLGEDAHALVTTPGAAKWYRANGKVASQDTTIRVGPGACLEWLPQETIFFNEAEVRLHTEVDLHPTARYLAFDVFCFGRTHSGERFERGAVSQKSRIRRDGRLVWFEQGRIAGGGRDMRSPLVLAGRSVCATLVAVADVIPPTLPALLREAGEALLAADKVDNGNNTDDANKTNGQDAFGVTLMKHVLVVRYLGNSSETARRIMTRAWQTVRPQIMGHDATPPRIWNT